jgi:hypothetical protein
MESGRIGGILKQFVGSPTNLSSFYLITLCVLSRSVEVLAERGGFEVSKFGAALLMLRAKLENRYPR